MDYWKIKQGLRKILVQSGEKVSDRAEARLIKMSQKGYSAMMNNHTMTVKKLEEVAELTKKPVSYFFTNNNEDDDHNLSEPKITTYSCPECINKQKELEKANQKIQELQEKYTACLEELLGKKGSDIANSA